VDVLVREAAAGGALEPAGQEGETGLPRRPWDARAGGRGWGTRAGTPCGCHLTPDLALGLGRGHRLIWSCHQGTPMVPKMPHYGSRRDGGGVAPGTPPPHPGTVPNAGDQQRGPDGRPRPPAPRHPSPTVSASPAACERRVGLEGAAGASSGKREPPALATGGTHRPNSGFKPGLGCDLLPPKNLSHLQFWLARGSYPEPPTRVAARGWGTDPAQLPAGLSPCAHHRDFGALCSPPNQRRGPHFFGAGLRLPAEPLSQHGAAGGAARRRAGDRARGRGGRGGRVT